MNTYPNPNRILRGGSFLRLLMALFLGGSLAVAPAPAAAQNGNGNDTSSVVRRGGERGSDLGRIVGRIVDESTSKPLSGVQVYIQGSRQGVLTDVNGRYLLLDVTPGTHDLVAEMIGFARKTITGVEVDGGTTLSLDIGMASKAIEMEAITVSAAREQGSTAFLMNRRASSVSMVDAVGAAQISRSPDSDAADVAQRMTGVTVSDGKYVFVRGLGERYSQTALNGSPLPSPEPEKEVVPLDLFPAGFLESLTTQKSYTPDQPSDFSGGTVEIRTKDFPDRFQFRLGMGTSFNSQSHFQSGFLSYDGGGMDYLGIDDGTRGLPREVTSVIGGLRGEVTPVGLLSDAEQVNLAQHFPTQFTPTPRTTPLNRSFDLSIGGSTRRLLDREMGFLLSGTYSDSYTVRDREFEQKWRVSAFDPDIPQELKDPNVAYDFTQGVRAVRIGVLGNYSVNLSPGHKLALRSTFNLNTDDEARRYSGRNSEDIGGHVIADRLRFVNRSLLWNQLSGEHLLPLESRLEWRATLARASRREPGLTEAIYENSDGNPDGEHYWLDLAESGRMFWSDLRDDDVSGELDWQVPFQLFGEEASLQVGGAYRARNRDFAARRFNWQFLGGLETNADSALAGGSIVDRARTPGQFSLDETVEPGDQYQAEDERQALYLMADLPLGSSLRTILGVRMEAYSLDLRSRGETLKEVRRTGGAADLTPSLNVVYSLGDRMKIRGAVSRTLDRPEFRELAPFQFTEAASLRQIYGNPDLEQAEIFSTDLRWDWFFGLGEVLSLSVFRKQIDNPVEQVFLAAASAAYSYTNGTQATVEGIELDAQVGLGRISRHLDALSLTGNVSLIDSETRVETKGAFVPTNAVRPLEGQAEYVLNTGITYQSRWRDVQVGVYLNRLGRRLTAAGGSGIPDIYEEPRNALDATFRMGVGRGGTLKIKGTNLLDEAFRFQQSRNGVTQLQRQYWKGRTLSVGLAWDLF